MMTTPLPDQAQPVIHTTPTQQQERYVETFPSEQGRSSSIYTFPNRTQSRPNITSIPLPRNDIRDNIYLSDGSNTVRVGRWMSQTEYNAMMKTGKVQMSPNGNTTHMWQIQPI